MTPQRVVVDFRTIAKQTNMQRSQSTRHHKAVYSRFCRVECDAASAAFQLRIQPRVQLLWSFSKVESALGVITIAAHVEIVYRLIRQARTRLRGIGEGNRAPKTARATSSCFRAGPRNALGTWSRQSAEPHSARRDYLPQPRAASEGSEHGLGCPPPSSAPPRVMRRENCERRRVGLESDTRHASSSVGNAPASRGRTSGREGVAASLEW